MNKDEIKSLILTLLKSRQAIRADQSIDNFNFIEEGVIDSISLIKFVIELEDKFSIDIESHDISNSNFKTVGGLTDLIHSKINAQ